MYPFLVINRIRIAKEVVERIAVKGTKKTIVKSETVIVATIILKSVRSRRFESKKNHCSRTGHHPVSVYYLTMMSVSTCV